MSRRVVRVLCLAVGLLAAGCASSSGTWIHSGLRDVPAVEPAGEASDVQVPPLTSPQR